MTKPATSRRPSTGFKCSECGNHTVRWVGRCTECQAWGTVTEIGASTRPPATQRGAVTRSATPIGEIDAEHARARATGVSELDRVLGGGLVPGSVVLLAGEPGVGKSTLLLTVAHKFAQQGPQRALIVTGEESVSQVRLRAERTQSVHERLYLASENDLGAVLSHVDAVEPGLLIVDSVQTISTQTIEGAPGGVPQIRAVTAGLIEIAKQRDIATVVVGHVTKDGAIAGPRVLEHLVDVVLHFEGDPHSSLRIVRATKNRFGAADELGCFEMVDDGIVGLADPSGLFLSARQNAVAGTCVCVTMEGRRPLITEIQALTDRSYGTQPRRSVTNLDGNRTAMLTAVLSRHARLDLATQDVYAATVGGMRATEPAADLAIVLAIASAARHVPVSSTMCAIGEVSLSGDVRRVSGLERRLAEAARLGFTTALVPASHSDDVVAPTSVRGIRCIRVGNITDALQVLANNSTNNTANADGTPPVGKPTLRTVPGAR